MSEVVGDVEERKEEWGEDEFQVLREMWRGAVRDVERGGWEEPGRSVKSSKRGGGGDREEEGGSE